MLRPVRRLPSRPSTGFAVSAVIGCLLLGGCSDAPTFRPDPLLVADQQLEPPRVDTAAAILTRLFGTPDHPKAPPVLAGLLDQSLLAEAAGPVASHTPGVTTGLYRRHCASCHGITGDGAGPAALYQHPYPRDFRQGVFKYKSTYRDAPPTQEDLATVLRDGIANTAMPSFALLTDREITALTQYVRYLALRGQAETALLQRLQQSRDASVNGQTPGESIDDADWAASELLPRLANTWREAHQSIVPVNQDWQAATSEAWDAAVAAGKKLFHDTRRANCVECHGPAGQGGTTLNDHDLWNKRVHAFDADTERMAALYQTRTQELQQTPPQRQALLEEQLAALGGQLDRRRATATALLPARLAEPRVLTPGSLRGTHTPQDLYRRIQQGIAGTPMPAAGNAAAERPSEMSEQELFQLSAYVMHLTGMPRAESQPATPAPRTNH